MYHIRDQYETHVSYHEKFYGKREKRCFATRASDALFTWHQDGTWVLAVYREHEKCRSFDDTFGCEAIHRHRNPTGWCPPPPALSVWSAVAAVRMMGAAFCEGLAAHREYEALRSRGIAHERALREALGLGCSRLPRETVTPLYFAGRA